MKNIELSLDLSDMSAVLEVVGQAAKHWPETRRKQFYREFCEMLDADRAVEFNISAPGTLETSASPEMFALLQRYGVVDGVM